MLTNQTIGQLSRYSITNTPRQYTKHTKLPEYKKKINPSYKNIEIIKKKKYIKYHFELIISRKFNKTNNHIYFKYP